ncbi:PPE domain-containing protein [Nocardia sp. NPDC049220]|uniref:PPE domain-containing protein n=1 Tax=Nocardia sp. NPDC049220 TaxID=3155273 RepID=UPI0033D584F4
MVEPPVIGFTGVVWQARPTEKLAQDLTTGPGAAPMADASMAWAKLAASFGAAVADYEQILLNIRESWRNGESEAVHERIAKLREWLIDAAAAASQNAAKAGAQAVAHEVARLAMPHVAEIAALEAAKHGIEQAGAALGAPLVAAAAQVDSEQDMAKANAARVMQSYEAAATPLAMPWQQRHPPVIATASALEAEAGAAETTAAAAAARGVPRIGGMPNLAGLSMPRAKTAYRAQTVSQSVAAPEVVPVESTPVVTDNAASRMVPGAMNPGTAAGDTERVVRAAVAATRPGEGLQIEAGLDAAPPVLGAAPEQARPESAPTEAAS